MESFLIVVGALIGMGVIMFSYPEANAGGYIIGAITGGMVVGLFINPNMRL